MSQRLKLRRADGSVYLDRHGWECRWFGVFLHKMSAPDPGVDLHDHPWRFASLILWGGYFEERADQNEVTQLSRLAESWPLVIPRGRVGRRSWLSIKAMELTDSHRITDLLRKHSWSIVFHGPKRRTWGFQTPLGWVDWVTYECSERGRSRDMWVESDNPAEMARNDWRTAP